MSELDSQQRRSADLRVREANPASAPHEVHQRRPGTPGARIRTAWQRPAPDLRAELGAFSTGVVADAMHRLGAMEGAIRPVWPAAQMSGPALTVWVRAGDNALIHEAIAMAEPGDVLMVNAQGSLTHAVFGELMALACRSQGIAGLVVDGAVRDAVALALLGFPVFARGACASGPLKDGTGEVGYPVACGGVVCASGDLVVADGDGVVIVPAADVETVLAQARRIEAWEAQRRELLEEASPPAPLAASS
jgi:regulator of RNase E activity RraA